MAPGTHDTGWFKSSRSGGANDNCVEVRMIADTPEGWFKSSYSGGATDNCVEVRVVPGGTVGVRDSKNPTAGAFWITSGAWASFVSGTRVRSTEPT